MTSVLLTGASGFIAKHIALRLLEAGHSVRASLRRLDRAPEITAALRANLTDPARLERLSFVTLDLLRDDGWTAAMDGIEALVHTASPFPLAQPTDQNDLIRPAVEGTRRALAAAHAAGVGRVILTSSIAAVMQTDRPAGRDTYDENDWTDPDRPGVTAYEKSKTLAERAAWDFVANDAPGMALTTINPGMVLGPPLDRHYASSIRVVERILRAKDPMVPNFGLPVVDVRDVAEAHVRALDRPASAGQRIILVDRFLWFLEMAEILKAAYPQRRFVTRRAPDAVVRMLALFDAEIRTILPMLGKRLDFANDRMRDVLGIVPIPAPEALRQSARWLVEHARV